MDELAETARSLGYLYIEWNSRILCTTVGTTVDNGMHRVGKSCDFPFCMAEELDQPGGVQWNNGMRPVLQDAKLMAHSTFREGTTLLKITSDRLMRAMMALVWPDTGDLKPAIESVLAALDDYSLRGADADGSIAAAVAALRTRVDKALHLCEAADGA